MKSARTATVDQPSPERLLEIIERFSRQRVLLIGDMVADHYIYGKTSRISREAPVLILRHQSEYVLPGQAANTANNIAALGGRVQPVGITGKDSTGRALKKVMRDLRIPVNTLIESADVATLTKTRILAGGHHTCRQQVIRIDNDERMEITAKLRNQAMALIDKHAREANAVVVSDYGYGLVTQELWNAALNIKKTRGIPLVLDSRYQLSSLKGATLITPNEGEALESCGKTTDADYDVDAIGRQLLRKTESDAVLITRGNEGMILYEGKRPPYRISIFGSDQVTDVTGAGDTVVASATLALAAGSTLSEAAEIANIAGGIVVMKMGTATVSREELTTAIHEGQPPVSQI